MKDAIHSLNAESERQAMLLIQYESDIEVLSEKKRILEDKKASKSLEYDEKRNTILALEKHCDDIFKQHESIRDSLAIQKAEKVRLSMLIQHMSARVCRF